MNLDPSELKDFFKRKRIDTLHHANTVATASNFLRSAKLMSRGRVEQLGLPQTPQTSDAIDKQYGVWDSIFTDSVDIHQRAKKRNVYGPVLLHLSLDILDRPEIESVGITKKNPTKWVEGEDVSERWFADQAEVESDFMKGRFDQMIVFQCAHGELDISDCLDLVMLDEPDLIVRGQIDLYSLGLGALGMARIVGGTTGVPIQKRKCHAKCTCGGSYRNTRIRDNVMKLFDPREAG